MSHGVSMACMLRCTLRYASQHVLQWCMWCMNLGLHLQMRLTGVCVPADTDCCCASVQSHVSVRLRYPSFGCLQVLVQRLHSVMCAMQKGLSPCTALPMCTVNGCTGAQAHVARPSLLRPSAQHAYCWPGSGAGSCAAGAAKPVICFVVPLRQENSPSWHLARAAVLWRT